MSSYGRIRADTHAMLRFRWSIDTQELFGYITGVPKSQRREYLETDEAIEDTKMLWT